MEDSCREQKLVKKIEEQRRLIESYEKEILELPDGADIVRYVRHKVETDYSPERKATWVGVSPLVDTIMCSNCGYNVQCDELATDYCPGCGYEMSYIVIGGINQDGTE